jgi:hypothetical protein
MKNIPFTLSKRAVWVLLLGAFILMALAFLSSMQGWLITSILQTLGSLFFFSAWVILLSDMFQNKIHNKTFGLPRCLSYRPLVPSFTYFSATSCFAWDRNFLKA